jgi:predicted negative regulator of RcsB-dependent stress response
VDTKTRHALKTNNFAEAAASSVSWLSGHRSGVLRWIISGTVCVLLVVVALITYYVRSAAAETALGAALDTYSSPLAQPGAPADSNVYTTATDRSNAANQQFYAVADKYGWLEEGVKARYFAGITDSELNRNAQAETELKAVSGGWNRNLSSLAKLALAGLYHQTNRDSQAIDLYNELAAKPSDTVPATIAQLDLGDLYAASGKQDQARALWAKVKDADKEGAAGQIASEKLDGK